MDIDETNMGTNTSNDDFSMSAEENTEKPESENNDDEDPSFLFDMEMQDLNSDCSEVNEKEILSLENEIMESNVENFSDDAMSVKSDDGISNSNFGECSNIGKFFNENDESNISMNSEPVYTNQDARAELNVKELHKSFKLDENEEVTNDNEELMETEVNIDNPSEIITSDTSSNGNYKHEREMINHEGETIKSKESENIPENEAQSPEISNSKTEITLFGKSVENLNKEYTSENKSSNNENETLKKTGESIVVEDTSSVSLNNLDVINTNLVKDDRKISESSNEFKLNKISDNKRIEIDCKVENSSDMIKSCVLQTSKNESLNNHKEVGTEIWLKKEETVLSEETNNEGDTVGDLCDKLEKENWKDIIEEHINDPNTQISASNIPGVNNVTSIRGGEHLSKEEPNKYREGKGDLSDKHLQSNSDACSDLNECQVVITPDKNFNKLKECSVNLMGKEENFIPEGINNESEAVQVERDKQLALDTDTAEEEMPQIINKKPQIRLILNNKSCNKIEETSATIVKEEEHLVTEEAGKCIVMATKDASSDLNEHRVLGTPSNNSNRVEECCVNLTGEEDFSTEETSNKAETVQVERDKQLALDTDSTAEEMSQSINKKSQIRLILNSKSCNKMEGHLATEEASKCTNDIECLGDEDSKRNSDELNIVIESKTLLVSSNEDEQKSKLLGETVSGDSIAANSELNSRLEIIRCESKDSLQSERSLDEETLTERNGSIHESPSDVNVITTEALKQKVHLGDIKSDKERPVFTGSNDEKISSDDEVLDLLGNNEELCKFSESENVESSSDESEPANLLDSTEEDELYKDNANSKSPEYEKINKSKCLQKVDSDSDLEIIDIIQYQPKTSKVVNVDHRSDSNETISEEDIDNYVNLSNCLKELTSPIADDESFEVTSEKDENFEDISDTCLSDNEAKFSNDKLRSSCSSPKSIIGNEATRDNEFNIDEDNNIFCNDTISGSKSKGSSDFSDNEEFVLLDDEKEVLEEKTNKEVLSEAKYDSTKSNSLKEIESEQKVESTEAKTVPDDSCIQTSKVEKNKNRVAINLIKKDELRMCDISTYIEEIKSEEESELMEEEEPVIKALSVAEINSKVEIKDLQIEEINSEEETDLIQRSKPLSKDMLLEEIQSEEEKEEIIKLEKNEDELRDNIYSKIDNEPETETVEVKREEEEESLNQKIDKNSEPIKSDDNDLIDINNDIDFEECHNLCENDENKKQKVFSEERKKSDLKGHGMVNYTDTLVEVPGKDIVEGSFERIVIIGDMYIAFYREHWPTSSKIKPFFLYKDKIHVNELYSNFNSHRYLTSKKKTLVFCLIGLHDIAKYSKLKLRNCSEKHDEIKYVREIISTGPKIRSLISSMISVKSKLENNLKGIKVIYSYLPLFRDITDFHKQRAILQREDKSCKCYTAISQTQSKVFKYASYDAITSLNQMIFSNNLNSISEIGTFEFVPSNITFRNKQWNITPELELFKGEYLLLDALLNDFIYFFKKCESLKAVYPLYNEIKEDFAEMKNQLVTHSFFRVIIFGDTWLKPVLLNWVTSSKIKPYFYCAKKISLKYIKEVIKRLVKDNDNLYIIVTVPVEEFITHKLYTKCKGHSHLIYPVPHEKLLLNATKYAKEICLKIDAILLELNMNLKNYKINFTTCYPVVFESYYQCLVKLHSEDTQPSHKINGSIVASGSSVEYTKKLKLCLKKINSHIKEVNKKNDMITCDIYSALEASSSSKVLFPSHKSIKSPLDPIVKKLVNELKFFLQAVYGKYGKKNVSLNDLRHSLTNKGRRSASVELSADKSPHNSPVRKQGLSTFIESKIARYPEKFLDEELTSQSYPEERFSSSKKEHSSRAWSPESLGWSSPDSLRDSCVDRGHPSSSYGKLRHSKIGFSKFLDNKRDFNIRDSLEHEKKSSYEDRHNVDPGNYGSRRRRRRSRSRSSRTRRSRSNSRARFHLSSRDSRSPRQRRDSWEDRNKSYARSKSRERQKRLSLKRKHRSRSPVPHPKKKTKHSREDAAVENLWDIHKRECDIYRRNPEAHPDYSRLKRMWYDVMVSQGLKMDDIHLHEQWKEYWPKKMEEIFKYSWEEKKEKCLSLLRKTEDSKSKDKPRKRSRSFSSSSTSSSSSSRSKSSRTHKRNTKSKSSKSKKEAKNYDVHVPRGNDPNHMSVEELETRLNEYMNNIKVPKVEGPFKAVLTDTLSAQSSSHSSAISRNDKLLEVTSILSQISDKFGALGVSLTLLHRNVLQAHQQGQNALEYIDEDARMLLDLVLDKIKRLLSDSSLSLVQRTIVQEAHNQLLPFLELLGKKKGNFYGLDIDVLAKSTLGMQVNDIVNYVKSNLSRKGVHNPSNEQLMGIYVEIKSEQMKLISEKGQSTSRDSPDNSKSIHSGNGSSSSRFESINRFLRAASSTSKPSQSNMQSGFISTGSSYSDFRNNFFALPMHEKMKKFSKFFSLPEGERNFLRSHLQDLEKTDRKLADSIRAIIERNRPVI